MTDGWTDRRLPALALVAVAVAGTAARVALLGERMAHWSEARLGYDVLRYAATGVFEYRPVTHGPLLYHVDRVLFELVGASDFAARLPVAVVGGLLPLSAWLYRDHLRDLEVVALGALLAANPVLLYYSRFATNDLLVAALAFTTLGLLVRTRATGRPRYLYAASAFGALAFAAKANAGLYFGLWAASALVVWDQRALAGALTDRPLVDRTRAAILFGRLRARGTPEMVVIASLNPLLLVAAGPFSALVTALLVAVLGVVAVVLLDDARRPVDRNAVGAVAGFLAASVAASGLLGDALAPDARLYAFALAWLAAAAGALGVLTAGTAVGSRIRRWRAPVVLSAVLFAAITLVLFAPRNPDGLGLWSALANPLQWPALVEAGLVDPLSAYGRVWLGGYDNDYLSSAAPLGRALAQAAVVAVAAAAAGFLRSRYGDRDDLVAFCTLWAGLSVLVYPVAVVVNAPWHAVHVVVPLAVPAAVGLAAVARRVPAAVRDRDVAVAAVALLVVLVATGAVLASAVGFAYLHPQDEDGNPLVQYGQPGDDFRETLRAVDAAAETNDDGPDVVYYGAYFHVDDESTAGRLPVDDVYREADGGYRLVGENEAWYNRLPLAWYLEAADASVDSADRRPGLEALLESNPPVVVTRVEHADIVGAALGGDYSRTTFDLTQRNVTVAVFVDESAGTTSRSVRDAVPGRPFVAPAAGGTFEARPTRVDDGLATWTIGSPPGRAPWRLPE